MAKHHKSGGGSHTLKYLLKLGATVIGGAVLGEVISPLTGPVSGPALGVAALGAVVYGPRGMRSYATHALLPAAGFQAVKTISTTKPMIVAKASISGATKALSASNGASGSDVARARALAGK